jgi:hypothetical protein
MCSVECGSLHFTASIAVIPGPDGQADSDRLQLALKTPNAQAEKLSLTFFQFLQTKFSRCLLTQHVCHNKRISGDCTFGFSCSPTMTAPPNSTQPGFIMASRDSSGNLTIDFPMCIAQVMSDVFRSEFAAFFEPRWEEGTVARPKTAEVVMTVSPALGAAAVELQGAQMAVPKAEAAAASDVDSAALGKRGRVAAPRKVGPFSYTYSDIMLFMRHGLLALFSYGSLMTVLTTLSCSVSQQGSKAKKGKKGKAKGGATLDTDNDVLKNQVRIHCSLRITGSCIQFVLPLLV